ncbi:MAG: PEP-CTERM sorting domain-containing protein [Pseudomonadales bacterium]
MLRNLSSAAALMVLLFSGSVQAGVISYQLHYFNLIGPSGSGGFEYEECLTNQCPSFEFRTAFSSTDPDLIFDQTLGGGGGEALLGFFEGDPSSTFFPAINLASLAASSNPISNLLSFESAGVGRSFGLYCIRPSNVASGGCLQDPGVSGLGVWLAKQVPEPGGLSLLAMGLVALALVRRRSKPA